MDWRGFVKTTRDTLFNNLYDYSSQGYYLKGGGDLHLNFKNHRSSGFRLGGGINFARFTEKGLLQFQYSDSLFEGTEPGNVYGRTLESTNLATTFEFRQGLFIDIHKLGLLFHFQQSILLREPEGTHHPAYYIPGTGVLTPIAIIGRGNEEPWGIIPAAYIYLFYKLY